MKSYIGIDPGAKGAVALIPSGIFGGEGKIWDCPGSITDMAKILLYCISKHEPLEAVIEKASLVIRYGDKKVRPNTKMAINFGQWEGILAAYEIPFQQVTPKKWQKMLDNDAKWDPKKRSYDMASRLFPDAELKGPKGGIKDGRCDALLLAEYLRRMRI